MISAEIKKIVSIIVRTSPAWGIVVNAIMAHLIARNTVKGKKLGKVSTFVVFYVAALLLLAVWSAAP